MNAPDLPSRRALKVPRFTAGLLILFFCLAAAAHPAVSVVRDSQGNIYYSDLKQVWRIAPDGTQTVAMPGVHTHELCLDASDHLYGEHLWYEGNDKWWHYVWRRSPEGKLEQIIPPTEGFLANYSFVRDAAGNMYWADREDAGGPAIRKQSPDRTVSTLLQSAAFRDIRWMTCAPNGTLYLIDSADLIRVDRDGSMSVMARRLSEDRFFQRHKVQGLHADDSGHVWVAVTERGVIKRVAPDGKVTVAARSPAPWRPSGVLAGSGGQLWILEGGPGNAVRVRHVRPAGKETGEPKK